MRLLNARSLALENFPDDREVPPYAILSHTWGDDEVSYQDLQDAERVKFLSSVSSHEPLPGNGFEKVFATCRQARKDNVDHIWVDTCCINKESSAELSEAINSMFRFYQNARVCYVHFCDVVGGSQAQEEDLQHARWFMRGWTLQELIAPRRVEFFDCEWEPVGHLVDMLGLISRITGIHPSMFRNGGANLDKVSVATKMSWASKRQMTRIEDEAYCLLGLFDVNMPMLYGEGSKAFVRLQEEIIKISSDHSIFAWRAETERPQLFAPSPAAFESSGDFVPGEAFRQDGRSFEMTNRGLRISLPVLEVRTGLTYAVLNCRRSNMDDTCIGLRIENARDGEGRGFFKSEKEFNLYRSVYDHSCEDCMRLNIFRHRPRPKPGREIMPRDPISGQHLRDVISGKLNSEQDLILRRFGPRHVEVEGDEPPSDCRKVRILTYDPAISLLRAEPSDFWGVHRKWTNMYVEAIDSIFAVGPAWGCQCSVQGRFFGVFYAYEYDGISQADKYYLRIENEASSRTFDDHWTAWNDEHVKRGRSWPTFRCNELPARKSLIVAAEIVVEASLGFVWEGDSSHLELRLNLQKQDSPPGGEHDMKSNGAMNAKRLAKEPTNRHSRNSSFGSKLMALMPLK